VTLAPDMSTVTVNIRVQDSVKKWWELPTHELAAGGGELERSKWLGKNVRKLMIRINVFDL